jgi:hypothetical protein
MCHEIWRKYLCGHEERIIGTTIKCLKANPVCENMEKKYQYPRTYCKPSCEVRVVEEAIPAEEKMLTGWKQKKKQLDKEAKERQQFKKEEE